jgi:hypothetical protein
MPDAGDHLPGRGCLLAGRNDLKGSPGLASRTAAAVSGDPEAQGSSAAQRRTTPRRRRLEQDRSESHGNRFRPNRHRQFAPSSTRKVPARPRSFELCEGPNIRANSDSNDPCGRWDSAFGLFRRQQPTNEAMADGHQARLWTKSWTCHFSLYSIRYIARQTRSCGVGAEACRASPSSGPGTADVGAERALRTENP